MSEAYDVEARRDAWEELRPIATGGSGMVVTLQAKGAPTRDPDTGAVTTTDPDPVDGCGMLVAFRADLVDGTRIRSTDKNLWLCGLDVTGANPVGIPAIGSKIALADGVDYEVINVDAYTPAGLHVWSYVQLRA